MLFLTIGILKARRSIQSIFQMLHHTEKKSCALPTGILFINIDRLCSSLLWVVCVCWACGMMIEWYKITFTQRGHGTYYDATRRRNISIMRNIFSVKKRSQSRYANKRDSKYIRTNLQ